MSSGKYKILDKGKIPYKIVLNQESETTLEGKPLGKKQIREMGGIFEITKNKKLKIVFYLIFVVYMVKYIHKEIYCSVNIQI